MRIDTHTISRWAAEIAGTDDPEARAADPGFLDTLDGETDALEIADSLIAGILDDEALTDAIKVQKATLAARQDRIEMRGTAKRRVLTEVLAAIGVRKLERPRATISLLAGKDSARVTDDAAIPSQLCTVKTSTTPDKVAIKAQIKAGVNVPGAVLERGPDSISVRVA